MNITDRMYLSLPLDEKQPLPSSPALVLLDGAEMKDRDSAHAHLSKAFGFPAWYGQNLDALWDMLTTWEEVNISFQNKQLVPLLLGDYGSALLGTLRDAAEENPRLHLHFEEK